MARAPVRPPPPPPRPAPVAARPPPRPAPVQTVAPTREERVAERTGERVLARRAPPVAAGAAPATVNPAQAARVGERVIAARTAAAPAVAPAAGVRSPPRPPVRPPVAAAPVRPGPAFGSFYTPEQQSARAKAVNTTTFPSAQGVAGLPQQMAEAKWNKANPPQGGVTPTVNPAAAATRAERVAGRVGERVLARRAPPLGAGETAAPINPAQAARVGTRVLGARSAAGLPVAGVSPKVKKPTVQTFKKGGSVSKAKPKGKSKR